MKKGQNLTHVPDYYQTGITKGGEKAGIDRAREMSQGSSFKNNCRNSARAAKNKKRK